MQALADEDEELLLQAAQQMTGGTLPAKAWLEGALWLDSRRSERVLPLLELGLQVWPDDLPPICSVPRPWRPTARRNRAWNRSRPSWRGIPTPWMPAWS